MHESIANKPKGLGDERIKFPSPPLIMLLKANYYCNKCETQQVETYKDGGGFWCPNCQGMLMILYNEYKEDIKTRKVFVANKIFFCPAATIRGIRQAIKDNKLKVK